ncbi:MAG: VF530 family protein [Mariniphaga sp.]
MDHQKNNPLHGITLEMILTQLVSYYGWEELGDRIRINCFISDPSIRSSLKFLRKTPWARAKVEQLYIETFQKGRESYEASVSLWNTPCTILFE